VTTIAPTDDVAAPGDGAAAAEGPAVAVPVRVQQEPPPSSDPAWRDALGAAIADPAVPALHAQAIVDLTSGRIAGYEMLSRFPGPMVASPDRWFPAADHWGVGAVLQSRVVRRAISLRSALPGDTFLTVNIDPHLLTSPQVQDALGLSGGTEAEPSGYELARIVIELTEHSMPVDWDAFLATLEAVRRRGGLIAVDDAGTGYAGLAQLIDVRPHIVKVDRRLVAGVSTDPVKRALVEMLGELAGRLDGWLLAEGIETQDDLSTLIALGVPLGQGWALGRPAPAPVVSLGTELVEGIRRAASRRELGDHVANLIERVETGTAAADGIEVVVDRYGRPSSVRFGAEPDVDWAPPLVVAPSAGPSEVARRAIARPLRYRFAPVVCTDAEGTVLGVIRMDALLSCLARSSSSPH
jgi:EAL domain-containing protein (putative c-di-GMP-specific phosphodiesterase class I)